MFPSVTSGWPIKRSLVCEERREHKDVLSFNTTVWTRWHLPCLRSISHFCSRGKWVSCVSCESNLYWAGSHLVRVLQIFLMYRLCWILSHEVNCVFPSSLISHQLRRLINPHLIMKTVLYQLMLVKAWLYDASLNMIQTGFTGTSKVWGRSRGSSLPYMRLTKTVLFMMNSRTIHASRWILKLAKITWR